MVTRVRSSSSSIFLFLLLRALLSAPLIRISMADSSSSVQIVYTERPHGEDPEAYHIRTLSAVLGSVEAAKRALLYTYKTAATGFSARLTPHQVALISKQPGVLQVVPSKTLQLHFGPNLQ